MPSKQIEVTCPCCDTILLIDTLTSKVMRRSRAAEVDETGKAKVDPARWDEARERVRDRRTGGEQRFEEALTQERDRDSDLDDLFERAKKKALGREDEEPPSDS